MINTQTARLNILNKLKRAAPKEINAPNITQFYDQYTPIWESDLEKIRHFANTMKSVNTEIIWTNDDHWHTALSDIIAAKKIDSIVLPTHTKHGITAQNQLMLDHPALQIHAFDHALEDWRETLFNHVSAGLTDVRCGIAQTGTLVLYPDIHQPRTMSLIPPIHIALFDVCHLYSNFHHAMKTLKMTEEMPTNVVLISGPSKTADIQLTLAYGAHGPRTLIVLAKLPKQISEKDLQ